MNRLAILSILLISALPGSGAEATTILLSPARVWIAGERIHFGRAPSRRASSVAPRLFVAARAMVAVATAFRLALKSGVSSISS